MFLLKFLGRYSTAPVLALTTVVYATGPLSSELPIGWELNGAIVHPSCFSYEWKSSDNFEKFAEYFRIDSADFPRNIGLEFGGKINTFDPIPAFSDGTKLALVGIIDRCSPQDQAIIVERGSVQSESTSREVNAYRIVGEIDVAECQELAPRIGVRCMKAYAVWRGYYGGGSMPMTFKMSWGAGLPSSRFSPRRIRSPSWTMICRPF